MSIDWEFPNPSVTGAAGARKIIKGEDIAVSWNMG